MENKSAKTDMELQLLQILREISLNDAITVKRFVAHYRCIETIGNKCSTLIDVAISVLDVLLDTKVTIDYYNKSYDAYLYNSTKQKIETLKQTLVQKYLEEKNININTWPNTIKEKVNNSHITYEEFCEYYSIFYMLLCKGIESSILIDIADTLISSKISYSIFQKKNKEILAVKSNIDSLKKWKLSVQSFDPNKSR